MKTCMLTRPRQERSKLSTRCKLREKNTVDYTGD